VNSTFDESVSLQPRAATARRLRVRGRLLRAVGALALAGLGLCLIVIWQRDTVRMAEAVQRLKRHLPALQAEIKRQGTLPLFFAPRAADPSKPARPEFIYQDADSIVHLRKATQPIILAHARGPRLILHQKGRAVIRRTGGQLSVEWINDDALQEMLDRQRAYVDQRQAQIRGSSGDRP